MRYHVLVTDYDQTIAEHGVVSAETITDLEMVRESGRRIVLVTGRQLDDLLGLFQRMELFDRVVAENGALLYRPETRERRLLSDPPPPEFIRTLRNRGIAPLSEGNVIVATHRPNETAILEVIRDLGLELQVIFNHGAVMVLPSGVNKASGLQAALQEIGFSPHNSVGIGDAENDHAFLAVTECSAAVDNALDALKKRVDYVTSAANGKGAGELIRLLVDTDLRFLDPALRQRFEFGSTRDGGAVSITPYGSNVLIAGSSGGGKSTLAYSFIEKLGLLGYQFCIVDPEGDYLDVQDAVVLGDNQRPPTVSEVIAVLTKPSQNIVVNLLGIPLKDRPEFFESLLHRLQELFERTGRPHWLIVDEAHHVLPSGWRKAPGPAVPSGGLSVMMITLEPDKLPAAALQLPDLVIAVGEQPDNTLEAFSDAVGQARPAPSSATLGVGEAIGWFWKNGHPPFWFRGFPPKTERQRHRRKYAEGELSPELSFYFRGAEHRLNLRAQNLAVFMQIAEGLDDETWLFHLREGDISRWFRDVIKDPILASEAERFEYGFATAAGSRDHILSEIHKRYMVDV
jgi:hydroxymethylpyrimidine pyrophosphatase-like HAD family hydrolase